MQPRPAADQPPERRAHASAGLKNLRQLIELRWIAVLGQIFTIEVAHYGLQLALPLREMLTVAACLAIYNVISLLRWKSGHGVRQVELFLALLVDVVALTAQLYLSGGTGNPFVFLYLPQITVGAMLLRGGYIWSIVAVAAACVALLAQYRLPLALNHNVHQGLASPYILGLLVCFVLNAILIVVFITRISRNLRQRDTRLAAARQRAAEAEHIVRMGLLASGAAHELGTPLATMAVILGDWRRDKTLTDDRALQEDIAEMQNQVQRCKTIVSGILLSAGETRGEESSQTSICRFLDLLAQQWHASRPVGHFEYANHFGADSPMAVDTTLQQMVFNVLDNARDASPHWVGLRAERQGELLCISVTDHGPGFAPDMLAQLGQPYQSSKGRPGGGLGLFLAVNVARTLGGSVQAHNRPEGGAVVTIALPLTAIAIATPVLHHAS